MKALSTAIYSKASASGAFWTKIGGRFYKVVAPATATFPYVVFKMISDDTDNTFREELEDVTYQFSIFSADSSSLQVEEIYDLLKSVFDKCSLSITGNTHIHMLRNHSELIADERNNPNGSGWVWHYAVDYNIIMQKN
jgi:hypothetical protein